MSKTNLRTIFTFLLLHTISLFYLANIKAVETPTDADIKVALTYNFLKYINYEWPATKKEITVKIFGEDPLLLERYQKLDHKIIKNRRIKVVFIDKLDAIHEADVLVVFNELNFEIPRIARLISGKPTLLITDRYSDKSMIMINFIHDLENKVGFEINSPNVEKEGFKIQPRLLLLGGTEVDVRDLYMETEQSLISERERATMIEEELKEKEAEIQELSNRLFEMNVRNDTLNSMIFSNIMYIQEQEQLLDSLKILQDSLNSEAFKKESILLEANTTLQSKNTDIAILDIQLARKQAYLEQANLLLEKKNEEILDKDDVLQKQGRRLGYQKKTIFIFIAFASLLMVFLAFIFRSYKTKQLRNIELQKRNDQINMQKEHIQAQAEQLKVTNLELQKLSIVAEKTDNAVSIMDKEGNLEWVNNGFVRMTGYTLDEFLSKHGNSFELASIADNPKKILRKCITQKMPQSYSGYFTTKEKKKKWLQTTITPIIDDKREVVKVVAIDTDITKLKKAEQNILKKNKEIEENADILQVQADNLRKANQEMEVQKNRSEDALEKLKNAQSQLVAAEKMASLGQLTSGIAHEINNPINYISSSIEGLRNIIDDFRYLINQYENIITDTQHASVAQVKEDIEYEEMMKGFEELTSNIRMGVDRTKEIVNSLRTFSRVDEDNFSTISINENIDSAIVLLGKNIKDRIKITKQYGELPMLECIAGKINQVFLNVLVNATQAIENKGEIIIGTDLKNRNGKEMAKISFTDTGIGMSKEVVEKIFDPFFTTKEVGKGTGLGLSITYSIVKKHNGEIEVKSQPGKGTSIIIYLPVNKS